MLRRYMREMLANTPLKVRRYIYDRIHWDAQMIGIVGPRGIGKSTLLKQYILDNGAGDDILYVSADNTYFATHTLSSLADQFAMEGGRLLVIDEIHVYKNWSRELKEIYDIHPNLHVIFTGSSILEINKGKADLSRRVAMYQMQGLSFREYLAIFKDVDAKVYSLEEILAQKVTLPEGVLPLPLFREYLAKGYYPFCNQPEFNLLIQQTVSLTTEVDIPQFAGLTASTARKLKQLLMVVAGLAPFKPNASNLATEIGVSKNNVPDYLLWLEKAGMIAQVRDDTGGLRGLGKVEKVYLDNPSLMTVLGNDHPNIGNLRETFFYNQMRVNHDVTTSRLADFQIGDLTFEVGGRKKGTRQIENAEHGIVVKDDIDYGSGIFVALWQFGMNY